jgi:hypothetical protein
MKMAVAAAASMAGALLVLDTAPALAHRLDEYLEATTIQISRQSVRLTLRLAPGVAVARTVLDSIDLNHDGLISPDEESAYATRVMNDLSLAIDGRYVALRGVSRRFPPPAALRDGTGEIQLAFAGEVAHSGERRTLTFDNRHRAGIAAYLVNAVVPDDPEIHITKQTRNFSQSDYEMTYEQRSAAGTTVPFDAMLRWTLAALAATILLASFAAQIRGRSRQTR